MVVYDDDLIVTLFYQGLSIKLLISAVVRSEGIKSSAARIKVERAIYNY